MLVDEFDRLLLFSYRERDGGICWRLAGGGLNRGESFRDAALRELREETGLVGARIGPELWRGRPWPVTWNGVTYEVRQRYFLVRCQAFAVNTAGFEDFERSVTIGHHWWTVDELITSDETFSPRDLPGLVAELLVTGPPNHPVAVND